MPTHDIIDNRQEKLVDHIRRILDSSLAARFAVGYFFLSGLEGIADRLQGMQNLRLLIGNTTNRETIEQMAEGYRRLDLVEQDIEGQTYPKRSETRHMVNNAAQHIGDTIEMMDQTSENERLLATLVRMIEEKRLSVRVYTKGRLHAKAYLFEYGTIYDAQGRQVECEERGIAIVGSSNLTLSGISHNTELNVVVHGNDNLMGLQAWFDTLWEESEDFDAALMAEMQQSWALAPVQPYDIYLKTLYTLVRDRIETGEEQDVLWDDEITTRLADFQKVAVRQAVQIIKDFGGAFVADVVGLGKSYIGVAIVKHFEQTEHARPLIICPAPLVEMWERYNEVYQLHARVLSLGYLRVDEAHSPTWMLEDIKYRDRDFVLIDESHNLRHADTQRYQVVQSFLATGRRCCLLTATPRNKSAWDVYAQIKLFHQDDQTDLPITPPNLREFFQGVEQQKNNLPELLSHILIRRTRNHILRWYGYDSETHVPVDASRFQEYLDGTRRAYVNVAGRRQFFPQRELETVEYSIEDTYQGLYQQLRGYLGKPRKDLPRQPRTDELTYARYGLWRYVAKAKQGKEPYVSLQRAGTNLHGLIRILLFKRFESSVYAFQQTIKRLSTVHELFLRALSEGIVPAGEEAQSLLYDAQSGEEPDLIDALREVSRKYDITDFDSERLRTHIEHDLRILREINELVAPITPAQDAKLQTLMQRLTKPPLANSKVLIFTQYADTARYLYDNLNPNGLRRDIDVIFSSDKDKARLVARFAPKANPEYRRGSADTELQTVIATDVLAEGLNLQDCDTLINYDLHWNPVRLIQRFGRIDRIGSDHDVVYGFNFLPELGIEKQLGLRQKLHNRVQEIHDTIGEDAAILDRTEKLNEKAMYAIYEQQGGQLNLFEEDEQDTVLDLSEAEEILRLLRKDNPSEYSRIALLRDGIRTGRPANQQGHIVHCKADTPDQQSVAYQQLFLVDSAGTILSRDLPRVLGLLKCAPEEPGAPLPPAHNMAVMQVLRVFTDEVNRRQIEREHTLSLTQSQRYIIRELRLYTAQVVEEDVREQLTLLERAFRGRITTAINKQLNSLRRNGLRGLELFRALITIYYQHSMRDMLDQQRGGNQRPIPHIISSEALL